MDKNWNRLNTGGKFLVIGTLTGLLIAGCGGGGTSNVPGTATSISGTAATGAPVVGQVVAIDANGTRFTATTSSAGAYTINVAGGTAPFILTVIGMSGGKAVTLNSVATAVGQTVNITPLTDLIVSTASGQPGGAALSDLCSSAVAADQTQCKAALTAAATPANLSAAVTAVTQMIAPLNGTNIDPLNGAFTANGTGMDALLDAILVTPAAAQGAMATVTLIAVPTQQLGTVTMPATAGGTATTATVTPSPATLTDATNASTVLSEIRVCNAQMNALYPANMTAAPTAQQVAPSIDATFSFGGPGSMMDQAAMITAMSTLVSAGGMAQPGFALPVTGLSQLDFGAQPDAATALAATTASPISANPAAIGTTAWVQMDAAAAGGGLINVKFVKNAAYTGCPGGWKIAGWNHIDMHMQARVNKGNFANTGITYSRELPFHVNTDNAMAEGVGSIVVTGPGLHVYDPAVATGVGAATPVTLVTPPVPPLPAVQSTAMEIQGALTGNTEAIQSCQDLQLAASTITGTPCYDETAVAPGAVFIWAVYDTAATPAVKYVFPFQVGAVPLSRAFVMANDANLFAQNITSVPNGVAALTTAVAGITAGMPMDNIITFHYTQSLVYGARTDHCGIGLSDPVTGLTVLNAEQDATGLQTSCTFFTAGLNSGSLAKPAAAMSGIYKHMRVSNTVLGNMAVSAQTFPD